MMMDPSSPTSIPLAAMDWQWNVLVQRDILELFTLKEKRFASQVKYSVLQIRNFVIFGLEMGFPAFEKEKKTFQMQGNPFQDRGNCGKNVKIARKLCGKFHFRISKSSTKFHFKGRKPHFKLRKAIFKRGLERNHKKSVLEFDVERDGGIILWDFFFYNFELCRLLCDGELWEYGRDYSGGFWMFCSRKVICGNNFFTH